MYRTILVPLDGSQRAEAILPHVEALAEKFAAKVIFLGVIEPVLVPLPVMAGGFGAEGQYSLQDMSQLEHDTREYLAGRVLHYQARSLHAEMRVVHGLAVETIADIAEQENVDLIAMASHGRTGLARVFYGSVAAGVLNRVDRPLLIIRAE